MNAEEGKRKPKRRFQIVSGEIQEEDWKKIFELKWVYNTEHLLSAIKHKDNTPSDVRDLIYRYQSGWPISTIGHINKRLADTGLPYRICFSPVNRGKNAFAKKYKLFKVAVS